MLRTLTILAGSVTSMVLAFQVAMISAMDIKYWDVADASSGWSIWYGVIAVGLMLGASILVLHQPRMASAVYLACLPLVILYESYQSEKFYSLEIPESLGFWIGMMTVVLGIMAYLCSHFQARTPAGGAHSSPPA